MFISRYNANKTPSDVLDGSRGELRDHLTRRRFTVPLDIPFPVQSGSLPGGRSDPGKASYSLYYTPIDCTACGCLIIGSAAGSTRASQTDQQWGRCPAEHRVDHNKFCLVGLQIEQFYFVQHKAIITRL